ncbi:hypothetical protein EGT74_06485 [Chitinophaga lutea]|uniref:RteC protein n=2 Tax=Chitinophaga lutea TaxID=2488634 RepID=A0A3N4QN94_9BACT|nr:hypothetical protein EGT74_06485 [Chitinophaga lutea]
MSTTFAQLLAQTTAKLRPVVPGQDTASQLSALHYNIALVSDALLALRHSFVQTSPTPADEIHFFREVKPSLSVHLVYYTDILRIVHNLPIADRERATAYLQAQTHAQQQFIERHLFYFQYFNSNQRHLDDKLFIRGASPKPDLLFAIDTDAQFTTGYDYLKAALDASGRVLQFLQDLTHWLLHPPPPNTTPAVPATALTWTGAKRGLIELTYALHEAAAFNNGNVDLKTIQDGLEVAFNVKLGNASRIFQEILGRKSGDTNFLELLTGKLRQRIEKMEEKNLRKR